MGGFLKLRRYSLPYALPLNQFFFFLMDFNQVVNRWLYGLWNAFYDRFFTPWAASAFLSSFHAVNI